MRALLKKLIGRQVEIEFDKKIITGRLTDLDEYCVIIVSNDMRERLIPLGHIVEIKEATE